MFGKICEHDFWEKMVATVRHGSKKKLQYSCKIVLKIL